MPVVGNEQLFNPNTEASPFFSMDTMDYIPGAITTTGWNLGRAHRTITTGGTSNGLLSKITRSGKATLDGEGGMIRQGIRQTFGPGHLRKLTRAANIDPSFYGASTKIYTPFNSLASIGNKLWDRGAARMSTSNAQSAKFVESMGGVGNKGEKVFSSGTLGRMHSMSEIGNMSDKQLAKRGGTIMNSIRDINPTAANWIDPGLNGLSKEGLRGAYQAGVGQGITGRVSGRVSGYVMGAENAMVGGERAAAFTSKLMPGTHFATGAGRGAAAAVGENATTLGKFVGRGGVSGILKGVNAASWILLAHDAAALIGKGVASVVRTGIDAAKSVQGSINKPVMGMGFKDNAIAATSRQRGVMAISNSRLNARSALGSEGQQMYARFG